jgi:hypothetical protein
MPKKHRYKPRRLHPTAPRVLALFVCSCGLPIRATENFILTQQYPYGDRRLEFAVRHEDRLESGNKVSRGTKTTPVRNEIDLTAIIMKSFHKKEIKAKIFWAFHRILLKRTITPLMCKSTILPAVVKSIVEEYLYGRYNESRGVVWLTRSGYAEVYADRIAWEA